MNLKSTTVHVEALSQLGPLRSRKGMSQLGIPKVGQTSKFLWHEPARCGHLRFQFKGNNDKPPFDGSMGGTLRAHPGLARVTRRNTLMDMHTELKAVPHAGLGFQFLRVHVRTTGSWRSSRGSKAQNGRGRATNRQVDVVACKSAAT